MTQLIGAERVRGDLLYHAFHGLFRVDEVIQQRQPGGPVRCYSLVPQKADKSKTRFTVAVTGIGDSGFRALVSLREAKEILQYLGKRVVAAIPSRAVSKAGSSILQDNAWNLAQTLLSFSFEKPEAKDPRSRQKLERSVKGLVGELALVFNMTLKEAAAKVRKSLGAASRVNPSVLAALAHAGED
ncbi:MAG: hypothetical protein HYU34_05350 [Candidatus Omnitrophica bacterium]|nr:hypothetical protein [Candidatus Omnitrophota bacterium]